MAKGMVNFLGRMGLNLTLLDYEAAVTTYMPPAHALVLCALPIIVLSVWCVG